MKIIYKAENITEAHIIRGLLEAHEIEAHVSGFYLQGGVGDLAAFDFSNVMVNNSDVEQALAIIAGYEGKPGKQNAHTITTEEPTSLTTKLFLTLAPVILILFIYYLTSA